MAIYRKRARSRKAVKRGGTGTRAKYKRRSMKKYRPEASKPSPRMQVGFTPGSGAAKSAVTSRNDNYTVVSAIKYPSDSPQQASVTTITKGSGIDNRERDIINCLGIKIQMVVANLRNWDPVCFHYALVACKGFATPEGPDFLRGYEDDRGLDFTPNNISGMDVLKSPINADKYTIFMHKRFWLRPRSDNPASAGAEDVWHSTNKGGMRVLEEYVKINRQLRFNDEGTCETPMYLVWWAGSPFKVKTAAAVNDTIMMTRKVTVFFREPK